MLSRLKNWQVLVVSETADHSICVQVKIPTLLVPASQSPKSVPLELRALLPTQNHNQQLISLLKNSAVDELPEHDIIAGVFAADSILPFSDLTRGLKRLGIQKVANFPSVTSYGPLIGNTLSDVGLGFQRECETLKRFQAEGFQTAMFVSTAEQKQIAEEAGHFAVVELAQSDQQLAAKLFTQRKCAAACKRPQYLYMPANAVMPQQQGGEADSALYANIDGLVLTAQ